MGISGDVKTLQDRTASKTGILRFDQMPTEGRTDTAGLWHGGFACVLVIKFHPERSGKSLQHDE